MEKIKNILTIAVFAVIILGLSVGFVLTPDNARSHTERRLLQQRPELTLERILNRRFIDEFEDYLQDQFVLREDFRMINALARRYILQKNDYEGYFLVGSWQSGHLSQMEFPLNLQGVRDFNGIFNHIYSQFLSGMNVHYAIIPDKNFFMAQDNGFLSMNYTQMRRGLESGLNDNINYIDLFDILSLDSFYRTDIHWRQNALMPAAQHLTAAMGGNFSFTNYQSHRLFPFYGSFHGPFGLPVQPDEMIYLTNDFTENARVSLLVDDGNRLTMQEMPSRGVYARHLFDREINLDSFDMFLYGAQSIVTIEVENPTTDRELIIFRDSFGSNLAPLFLESYAKVTLVDIRYIGASFLPQFIDFDIQDVLILYSAPMINRGGLLRWR